LEVHEVVCDLSLVSHVIVGIEVNSLGNVHCKITELLSLENGSKIPWIPDLWVWNSLVLGLVVRACIVISTIVIGVVPGIIRVLDEGNNSIIAIQCAIVFKR